MCYSKEIMASQPTSLLPAVYFYEDVDTAETARQCTFFDNACEGGFIIKFIYFIHCQVQNTAGHIGSQRSVSTSGQLPVMYTVFEKEILLSYTIS